MTYLRITKTRNKFCTRKQISPDKLIIVSSSGCNNIPDYALSTKACENSWKTEIFIAPRNSSLENLDVREHSTNRQSTVSRVGFMITRMTEIERVDWKEIEIFSNFTAETILPIERTSCTFDETVRVNFRATYRTRSRPFKLTQQRNNRITRRNEQSEVKFRHFPTK